MREHLVLLLAPLSPCSGQELGFFGVLEIFEPSHGAAQVHLGSRSAHEIDRDEMAHSLTVLRLDDEMGECPGDGIDDDASQFSAGAVATRHVTSNDELRGLAHDTPLVLLES